MSESKFETVSLLVDNFQQSDEKFDAIIEDEQLSDTWDRYHLIGDVIRGDVSSSLPVDFSTSIAEIIATEPTVLAPMSVNKSISSKQAIKAKIVQLFKPVGQLAIAASAAGLMILGVQHNVAQNESNAVMPSQVVQTIPFAGVADPVSLNFQQPDRQAQKNAYIEQQRRFQALLSDHQRQIKLKSTNDKKLAKNKVENTSK